MGIYQKIPYTIILSDKLQKVHAFVASRPYSLKILLSSFSFSFTIVIYTIWKYNNYYHKYERRFFLMDKLTPYFPLNKKVDKNNVVSLIIVIAIYIVVAAVLGVVVGIMSLLPIVNIIGWVVSVLIGIYELIGIILAVLAFVK